MTLGCPFILWIISHTKRGVAWLYISSAGPDDIVVGGGALIQWVPLNTRTCPITGSVIKTSVFVAKELSGTSVTNALAGAVLVTVIPSVVWFRTTLSEPVKEVVMGSWLIASMGITISFVLL